MAVFMALSCKTYSWLLKKIVPCVEQTSNFSIFKFRLFDAKYSKFSMNWKSWKFWAVGFVFQLRFFPAPLFLELEPSMKRQDPELFRFVGSELPASTWPRPTRVRSSCGTSGGPQLRRSTSTHTSRRSTRWTSARTEPTRLVKCSSFLVLRWTPYA